ncbi:MULTISPECIES: HD-GYP domain-containing protein [Thermodesulfovibrio]|jgi:HD-GYP domain-containing protein (c-di-GMP phosphodiesterase class II)|uniref:HD-GYP domain-containing protein n=1 Tax=Thermodesulfovibrio TaxID=28261 RepID=UPI00261ED9AE|nr:HD domain-containing phosphohydrolase [Thermodesulfovibrio sp.]
MQPSINLTVNWDIDNRKLIPVRNIHFPRIEISFNRDFAYPDVWVYESEEYDFDSLLRIKDRPRYFTVYFARKFFFNIEEFSFLSTQLAGHRIILFSLFDDVLYFLRKMLLIKEAGGLISAAKVLLESVETDNERLVISEHSRNVAEISHRISTMLGENDEDIKIAGLIHDIGKICIPASLLFSDKTFDDQKIKIFQLHALWGEALCDKLSHGIGGRLFLESIGFHHERLNGKGYLRGIRKNIPDIAKIIAVSDVYTALTEDRPYRMHFDKDVAITYINAKAGELFDPEVVEAFKKII